MSATDALLWSDVHTKIADGRFRLAMAGGIARAIAICASDNPNRGRNGVLAYVLLRVQHVADDRFQVVETVATDGKILGRWRDEQADANADTFNVFVGAKELLRLKLRWDSEFQLSATGRLNSPDYGCELVNARGSTRDMALGRITTEHTFPDYTRAMPDYPKRSEVGRFRLSSKVMDRAIKALGSVGKQDKAHGVCYCVDQVSEDRPVRLSAPDGRKGVVEVYVMPLVVG